MKSEPRMDINGHRSESAQGNVDTAPINFYRTKDAYGGDGSGKKMLGRFLMELRAELRGPDGKDDDET